ncbi:MAG: DciA family protein [Planctomycetota bacterium]|jgi:hypothetical protein
MPYDRGVRDALTELEQLRAARGRRDPDLSITSIVAAAAQQATRTHRRLGRLIELWRSLLPPELADRTSVTGFRGGVVEVRVDSSGVAWEIDRRLRAGLTDELRRGFPGTIVRVRLRVGAPPSDAAPGR